MHSSTTSSNNPAAALLTDAHSHKEPHGVVVGVPPVSNEELQAAGAAQQAWAHKDAGQFTQAAVCNGRPSPSPPPHPLSCTFFSSMLRWVDREAA